jgi:phage major head subunit gpT-like protein
MDQQILSSRAIRGMYFARLEQNPGLAWVNAVSNLFDSDQASENYAFLGQSPTFREWLGDRNAKGLRSSAFEIRNKHYESTLEIAVRDARRDKTGQISARVNEWVDRSLSHWASLLSTLLINGATTVCYDGQYYFDTDHSEGDSGSQSNSITVDISNMPTQTHGASAAAPSVEEMQYMMLSGISQILGFKDDQGEPMNENATQFTVLVPTSYAFTALQAVSGIPTANSAVANLNPNVLANFTVNAAVNPRLNTWTDKIAIFRSDSPIKGLIRQQETAVDLKVKAEGSEFEFDNDAWQFGIDSWRAAGYGYWQRACLVQAI